VTSLPTIGPNQVFEDDDGDGVFDKGEKGLPNVGVTLYNTSGKVIAFTVTNDLGTYSFTNLQPGEYYISVNKIPDFEWSPVVKGGNQVSFVENVAYENKSPTVTLGPGDNDRTLLVGMFETAILGNKVWNDLNGDGVQQTIEPGMNDVTAMLFNGGGVQIDTTKTDSDGYYLFSGIKPGNYSVKFLLPDSFVFTVRAKDSVVIVDPSQPDNSLNYNDVTSDADALTGQTNVKTLKSGEENYSFDAGMFIPITVNGTTWHDMNADGIEGDDEPGLSGVVVTLYDRDGDLVRNTTTGSDGVWTFNKMPPGTYHVKITPPIDSSGTTYQLSPKPANQTSFSTDFDTKTWMTTPTAFKGGSSSDGLFDAGLYLPASIGDKIWFDDTPNGIQDGDEKPFDKPVSIKLYDELGYIVNQTTSSESGSYIFSNVRPGTYSLEFILPEEDYKFTIPNAGNDTSLDSDVSPTTGRTTVTVASGEKKVDVDAGVLDYGPYYPDWKNDVQGEYTHLQTLLRVENLILCLRRDVSKSLIQFVRTMDLTPLGY
jgi:protocatechuate 3,4-dioxygenase beta subunit